MSSDNTNFYQEEVDQRNFRLLVLFNLLFFFAMLATSIFNDVYNIMFGSIVMILICVSIYRGGRIARWVYIVITVLYNAMILSALAMGRAGWINMDTVLNMMTITIIVITLATSVLFVFAGSLRNIAERKFKIALLFFAVSVIIGAVVYTFPRHYAFIANGIMYQLGEENNEFAKQVAVQVNGKMKRSMDGVRTFAGMIDIEGEIIPIPEDGRQLELTFGQRGYSPLVYFYAKNGNTDMFTLGGIFVNANFSKFTIQKYEIQQISATSRSGSWNSNDGMMISVPAQTRDEALRISNELMKDHLKGYILK